MYSFVVFIFKDRRIIEKDERIILLRIDPSKNNSLVILFQSKYNKKRFISFGRKAERLDRENATTELIFLQNNQYLYIRIPIEPNAIHFLDIW